MNALIRWARFNLVGAIGMVVQLSALALFNRVVPGHVLCATAAAIELTLLHNFFWHLHLTWRDRRKGATWMAQLLRFQLSNGVVSLFGNICLMWILTQQAHLPVLPANGLAILGCSMVNFLMGDRWAFAEQKRESK